MAPHAPSSSDPEPDFSQAGWAKRLFARLQAGGHDGYEAAIAARKATLFGELTGDVLEIGPGGGPNLRYFGADVRWVGVEPNPYMHTYLRQAAAQQGREIEIRQGQVEALPAADSSMDAVVSTLVLCSVDDVAQALAEVRRVLRPGGKFVFVEHVAAPSATIHRRLQRAVRPIWRLVADGCRPDQETWAAIQQAGFAQVEIDHFDMDLWIVHPHIAGYAVH